MSHMDPGEIEHEPSAPLEQMQEQLQDEHVQVRNEQSLRTFFAFLSFCIAIILLAVFFTSHLDSLPALLVLFGLVGFGMLGILLLEKRGSSARRIAARGQDATGEAEHTVEATTTEAREDETEPDGSLTAFELLVREALDSIPEEFHARMDNLVVLVESEPDAETEEHVGLKEGRILLGLYQGTPLTAQGYRGASLPERITIYQRAIEYYCHGDPGRIREQVRKTVLHEVAHHFGMGHEEMPIWVK